MVANHISQGNLRGESGLFFTHVNVMERGPYWQSRMKVLLYLARSCRTICMHYCCRLITIMRVWCSPCRKGNSHLLGRLSCEKIQRYNNSAPYVTPRWLLQQIPTLNFHDIFLKLSGLWCWLSLDWLFKHSKWNLMSWNLRKSTKCIHVHVY